MCFCCGLCCWLLVVFFFKQKTAYELRISDWSSDVCSSDLAIAVKGGLRLEPLCDCRISASLRQNLIEQAAILIVQRIGSDCLDRPEHRKLAPFHGVENREIGRAHV